MLIEIVSYIYVLCEIMHSGRAMGQTTTDFTT